MGILKPVVPDRLRDLDEDSRMMAELRMLGNMTDLELKAKDHVYRLLKEKQMAGSQELDMQKMKKYVANVTKFLLTEFQLRRLIISFEFDHTLWSYFKIINGDGYFESEDKIRAQQISRWSKSQLQGKNISR